MRIKAWAAAFYLAVSKEPLRQRGSRQVNVWPGEDPAHEPCCSLRAAARVLPPLASEQPLAGSALGEKVKPVSHSPDPGRKPSPTLLVLLLRVRLITVTPEIPAGQALCMACLPFPGLALCSAESPGSVWPVHPSNTLGWIPLAPPTCSSSISTLTGSR